ncbi:ubiquinol-cytochrome c reductase iron-sulfur subunit [candidate division KSB1 bacterium]
MDRRDFLKISKTAVVCTCLGAGFNGCKMVSGVSGTASAPDGSFSKKKSNIILDLSKTPVLKVTGGVVKLKLENNYDEIKIIVINSGINSYKAFADKCTHMGRELEYYPKEAKLTCVSFGHSQFDLDGNVLKGPASDRLKIYPVKLESNKIIIKV